MLPGLILHRYRGVIGVNHIGDRESDIYELFCKCESLGSKFVFRTCVDRRADGGRRDGRAADEGGA